MRGKSSAALAERQRVGESLAMGASVGGGPSVLSESGRPAGLVAARRLAPSQGATGSDPMSFNSIKKVSGARSDPKLFNSIKKISGARSDQVSLTAIKKVSPDKNSGSGRKISVGPSRDHWAATTERDAHKARVAVAIRRRMGGGDYFYTVKSLAGLLGCTAQATHNWLNGSCDPSSYWLGELTRVFGAEFLLEVYGEKVISLPARRAAAR
jgi:hypothetical protein